MKKAFTLAEIMIVLAIIGVITAVLLPIAINSAPDENVMKFKKANNTLGTAIRELINSDEYYLNGDLATKADGTLVDSETYFCETLADILNIKEQNCSKLSEVYPEFRISFLNASGENGDMYGSKTLMQAVDDSCRSSDAGKIREIVTPDGVVFYQVRPFSHYGIKMNNGGNCTSSEEYCNSLTFHFKSDKGFLKNYAAICIDIDGVPESATVDDCVNECPFGYALRVDGKLIPGKRADEWMAKSMQKGD